MKKIMIIDTTGTVGIKELETVCVARKLKDQFDVLGSCLHISCVLNEFSDDNSLEPQLNDVIAKSFLALKDSALIKMPGATGMPVNHSVSLPSVFLIMSMHDSESLKLLYFSDNVVKLSMRWFIPISGVVFLDEAAPHLIDDYDSDGCVTRFFDKLGELRKLFGNHIAHRANFFDSISAISLDSSKNEGV
jgi:hypothetical protein